MYAIYAHSALLWHIYIIFVYIYYYIYTSISISLVNVDAYTFYIYIYMYKDILLSKCVSGLRKCAALPEVSVTTFSLPWFAGFVVAWRYREIATAARNGLWKNRLVDWRPFWLSMLYGRYIEICYCYGRYIDILYGFWLSMVYGEQNILVYEINYKPPIVWLIYIYHKHPYEQFFEQILWTVAKSWIQLNPMVNIPLLGWKTILLVQDFATTVA